MLDQRIGDFPEGGLNHAFDGIRASCCWASASRTPDLMRPALKIGCVTAGANCHTLAGPEKRFDRESLWTPRKPVRLIRGKYAAFATPMKALAATRFCSAALMSGRRSRSEEGNPGGTEGGLFLFGQGTASRLGLGVAAEQKTDLILGLFDEPLRDRNCLSGAVHELLALAELDDDSAAETRRPVVPRAANTRSTTRPCEVDFLCQALVLRRFVFNNPLPARPSSVRRRPVHRDGPPHRSRRPIR